ncbi:hypothetical protein [Halohasta salina]|uniref:hypothetical protein n=1 Tax=Halohasta salina TaxID=2961621 RepID=UPI0020A5F3C1|nr:hypothetical protein [Halohasta salina]
MSRVDAIDHPAVELKLPVDGGRHRLAVPRATTLFFWVTLAMGTPDRLPPIDSARGLQLFHAGLDADERLSWTVSIDGASLPLMDDTTFEAGGYKGLAWWTVRNPVDLPAVVEVEFETRGAQPTVDDEPVVAWSEQGEPIP